MGSPAIGNDTCKIIIVISLKKTLYKSFTKDTLLTPADCNQELKLAPPLTKRNIKLSYSLDVINLSLIAKLVYKFLNGFLKYYSDIMFRFPKNKLTQYYQ